tara:strand:- start:178 stop:444 length:267 start_codon:yes stop_codon:yes gene_type:complete
MKVSTMALLPLLSKLGEYFKAGLDHYIQLKASGAEANPDIIAMFIFAKMEAWNPKLLNRQVLDHDTKTAAARMLGGLIVNLSQDRAEP